MAEVRSFGRVKVILGERNGKYPSGNSILVEDEVTALIDPSLMVRQLAVPAAGTNDDSRAASVLGQESSVNGHDAGRARLRR